MPPSPGNPGGRGCRVILALGRDGQPTRSYPTQARKPNQTRTRTLWVYVVWCWILYSIPPMRPLAAVSPVVRASPVSRAGRPYSPQTHFPGSTKYTVVGGQALQALYTPQVLQCCRTQGGTAVRNVGYVGRRRRRRQGGEAGGAGGGGGGGGRGGRGGRGGGILSQISTAKTSKRRQQARATAAHTSPLPPATCYNRASLHRPSWAGSEQEYYVVLRIQC